MPPLFRIVMIVGMSFAWFLVLGAGSEELSNPVLAVLYIQHKDNIAAVNSVF